MDEKVKSEINTVLAKVKKSVDVLPTATQKQLVLAHDAIDSMAAQYDSAKNVMRATQINITNVSRMSGVSRKTFYNNDVLKEYVELSADKTPSLSSPDNITLDKYKAQIADLKQRINDFLINNAVDSENAKCDYDDLLDAFSALQKQYDTLREQYDRIAKERDDLQKQVNQYRAQSMN